MSRLVFAAGVEGARARPEVREPPTQAKHSMEAGWLQTKQGALFACYHRPSAPLRDRAVILCDAFGSDRMTLHMTYRALAERLAALGFAALRVDYAATCDSSGYPRGTAQVSLALMNLSAACDWLRADSGAGRVVAFGAGLGASLAAVLASGRHDIDGLALWSPLGSGRTFLRAAAAVDALGDLNPHGLRPSDHQPGDVEAVGFPVSAATARELNGLDLRALRSPVAERIACFGRARADDPLVRRLGDLCAQLHLETVPELDLEQLQQAGNRPPEPVLQAVTGWFDATYPPHADAQQQPADAPLRLSGPEPAHQGWASSPASNENAPAVRPASDGGDSTAAARSLRSKRQRLASEVVLADPGGALVREELVRFGADRQLFGIVTRPVQGLAPQRSALVLVSGGHNHRSGINRNYTEWARRLAGLGLVVLRFDIRGLGDSPPERPEQLGVLYRDETVEDVRAAIDALVARYGVHRVACAGLCAGAYQALHAACIDPRITGLVMLNPLRFERAGAAGGRAPLLEMRARPTRDYARAILRFGVWQRVARGQVDVRGISRAVGERWLRRVRARVRIVAARARGEPPPAGSWLASAMRELTDRGCRALFVLDAGDPMTATVQEHLGREQRRLAVRGRFSIELIKGADHIFRPLFSQERVYHLIERFMLAW